MDRTSRTRWLVGVAMAAALVGGDIGRAQRVSDAEIRLQEALHKEHVEGNLAAAMALYERIASDKQTPRAVAAQALLNLGRCHEKLGSREAQKAYERIVQEFADQAPVTAEARSRLAALSVPATVRPGGITSSKVATAARLFSRNVSADGRFVVASIGEGFGVVDLTMGGFKLLDHPERFIGFPTAVISPDGKRVAYIGSVKGAADFRVVNVDGSGTRIVNFGSDVVFVPRDWSRDGRQIAGVVVKLATTNQPPPLPGIAILDVASGKFNTVEDALAGLDFPGAFVTTLRFSPDGLFVAFVVRRQTNDDAAPGRESAAAGDLFTMRVDGRDRQRLALGDEPVELVSWLPDGQGIAFVSERNSVRTMFGVPVQGGTISGPAVTLFRDVGRNQPLGFTASGALTYAVDGRVVKSYIADTSADPPVRTAVNASDREWDMSPSWSPDGRYLAFTVLPPFNFVALEKRLVIRDITSGQDRVLLRWHGLGPGRRGSWTSDGTGYVLARTIGPPTLQPTGFEIDRIDVATGAVQTLLPPQGGLLEYPRLTPDGRHLYFVTDWSQLVRVDLVTQERTELASIEQFYDLSADGAQLAYIQMESSVPVLKVQPVEGGAARVVMRAPQERITAVAFDAKGESLFVAKNRDGRGEILRVPLSGPTNTVPLGLLVTSWPDISVHQDGRRLAFIDNQWSVDFWQMNGLVDAFRTATRPRASDPLQPRTAPRANR